MVRCIQILFICLLLFTTGGNLAHAQFLGTKKKVVRRVERYSCPIVRKIEAKQAVGLKVGDPIGVTYKAYLQKRYALEAVLGTTTNGAYIDFIRESFEVNSNFADFGYLGHSVNYSVAFQARALVHFPLPAGISGEVGVDWYLGAGINVRVLDIEYVYETGDTPQDFEIGEVSDTYTLSGPEFIMGFEYLLPDTRFSVFAEGNLFIDTQFAHSEVRLQGGVGARYNF